MSQRRHKVLLMGLPEAGKTTFLAALFHVLESGDIQPALSLDRLHGDHSHLNEIRGQWANVRKLERTVIANEQVVSVLIRDNNSTDTAELVLPDMSGESFREQWSDRRMSTKYQELARNAMGALLLIHPERVREETLIPDVALLVQEVAAASGGSLATDQQTAPEKTQTPPWNPDDSPTAIKLVELLQFVANVNSTRLLMLSIVVSAWDKMGQLDRPETWIKSRLPLLWQYLTANPEVFSIRYFGVSAQGGELSDAEALRRIAQPAERIKVVSDDSRIDHDITAPVCWALGWGGRHV